MLDQLPVRDPHPTESLKRLISTLVERYGWVLLLQACIQLLRESIPETEKPRADHPHAWASHYIQMAQTSLRVFR